MTQTPLADMRFQVKMTATAEVRDAQGRLLNPDGSLAEPGTEVTATGTEELTGAQLAERYTDGELAAAGFTEHQIAELRGTQQDEHQEEQDR